MAQVTMTIDLDGNATIEVNGVQGPQCKDLTANIEKMLGTVKSVEHTTDMEQMPLEDAQNQMGQF